MGAADSQHVRYLNALAAEHFAGPSHLQPHGVERLYAWTGRVRSPWDGILALGMALGLYAGALGGAWIGIQLPGLLGIVLGTPIVVFSMALAAHLVPR